MYRIVVPCQVISRIFIWPAISTGGARTGPQRGIDVDAAGCRWPARMSAYLSLFPAAVPAASPVFRTCGSLGVVRCVGLASGRGGGSLPGCETTCAVRGFVGGEATRGVAGGGWFLLAATDPRHHR